MADPGAVLVHLLDDVARRLVLEEGHQLAQEHLVHVGPAHRRRGNEAARRSPSTGRSAATLVVNKDEHQQHIAREENNRMRGLSKSTVWL